MVKQKQKQPHEQPSWPSRRPMRKFASSLSSSWCDEESTSTLGETPKAFPPPREDNDAILQINKQEESLNLCPRPMGVKMLPPHSSLGGSTIGSCGTSQSTVVARGGAEEPDWDEDSLTAPSTLSPNQSLVSLEEAQDWYDPMETARQIKTETSLLQEPSPLARSTRSAPIQKSKTGILERHDTHRFVLGSSQKDNVEPLVQPPSQEEEIQPSPSAIQRWRLRMNTSLLDDNSSLLSTPRKPPPPAAPTTSTPSLATQVFTFMGMNVSLEKTIPEGDDENEDQSEDDERRQEIKLASGESGDDEDDTTAQGKSSWVFTDLVSSHPSFDVTRLEVPDADYSVGTKSWASTDGRPKARKPRLSRVAPIQGETSARRVQSLPISKRDGKPSLPNIRLNDDDWCPMEEEDDLVLSPTNRSLLSFATGPRPSKPSSDDSRSSRHRLSRKIGQRQPLMSMGDAISLSEGSFISNAFQPDPTNRYSIPWLGWSARPQLKENKNKNDNTSSSTSRSIESSTQRTTTSDSTAFQNDPLNSGLGYTFDDNSMSSSIESTLSTDYYRLEDYFKPSLLCRGAACS
eukprot:scaffold4274_cov175-Amphora_coffeaeformis.AAC.13